MKDTSKSKIHALLKSGLTGRILTGAALLSVLGMLLVLPLSLFIAVLLAVAYVCGWEWSGFMGFSSAFRRHGYAMATMLSAWLLTLFSAAVPWLQIFSAVGWLVIGYWVLTYPGSARQWAGRKRIGLTGLLIMPVAVSSLVWLRSLPDGSGLFAGVLGICIVTDISAYVCGSLLGGYRLLPAVSPGKTFAGLLGAMGGGLAMCLTLMQFSYPGAVVGIAALVAMPFAVLGDLSESMLKRQVGLKDSAHWLPGHGGALDRLDSLLAAAPVFTLVVWYLS